MVEGAADDRGAESVFLTLENKEDTRAYEDWSCSSSSEKGLKDVRLVTSSTIFVLLRDLDEGALWAGLVERESVEESMVVSGRGGSWESSGHEEQASGRQWRSCTRSRAGKGSDAMALHVGQPCHFWTTRQSRDANSSTSLAQVRVPARSSSSLSEPHPRRLFSLSPSAPLPALCQHL